MQPYPYPIDDDAKAIDSTESEFYAAIVDQFVAGEYSVAVGGKYLGIHDLLDLGYTVILTKDSVRIEKKC